MWRSLFLLPGVVGALLPAALPAQPAFQVDDLCTFASATQEDSTPGLEAGGLAFFRMDDGLHGLELWRTDGTDAGTFLLGDLCPGTCHSLPSFPIDWRGSLYFLATTDGAWSGMGLWTTDGTVAGTEQVLPLHAHDLIALPDRLLLVVAYPPAGRSGSLWVSDGTEAGTWPIADLVQGRFLGEAGGSAFFSAWDSERGLALWRSDGTAAGTFPLRDVLDLPASGRSPTVNGRLFFAARPRGTTRAELWVSDGTPAGTWSINQLVPETSWGNPSSLVARGNDVFFVASGEGGDGELWKTDGTKAGTLRLSAGLDAPSSSEALGVVGSEVYFSGFDPATGHELWRSDGTIAGTVQVADINPGPADSLPPGRAHLFGRAGSRFAVYADDGVHGYEPWGSEGTAAGTSLLADIEPGGESSAPNLGARGQGTAALGQWFFGAWTWPQGWALWGSDGTAAGTRAVHRFPLQTSSRPLFFPLKGRPLIAADPGLYQGRRLFRAAGAGQGTREILPRRERDRPAWIDRFAPFGDQAVVSGQFLWITDGTAAGTRRVMAAPANPQNLVVAGNQIFFMDGSLKVWRSDGTDAGTRRIGPDLAGFAVTLWPIQDGIAFWFAEGSGGEGQLWVSDGTAAGTHVVKRRLTFHWLARLGSRFLFSGWSLRTFETAIWASDGTARGTRVLTSRPGFSPIISHPQAVFWRGRLYFVFDDGIDGPELWASDGTRPGTRRVATIRPGLESPQITEMAVARDRIYFTADDGVHGRELWSSDGTAEGTRLVRDVVPGPGSLFPQNLQVAGHVLLFAATDGEHGLEPWVSDGTAEGTRLLQDIAPGPDPSSPSGFTGSGAYIYFSANDGNGFEPWAVRRSALEVGESSLGEGQYQEGSRRPDRL